MSAKLIASMCPIEQLLVLISGRWKPVILWWLFESSKPLRFKTLRHHMPRISQKVLTQQLRELERDGLVNRQVFPEMPVRVEYSLTPFGRKLRPVLRVLDSWSRKHWKKKPRIEYLAVGSGFFFPSANSLRGMDRAKRFAHSATPVSRPPSASEVNLRRALAPFLW
jgi:DNA-binding HxlR family transcriptional regulator